MHIIADNNVINMTKPDSDFRQISLNKDRMLPRLTSDCEDECEDILIYCSVNVHIIFAATT